METILAEENFFLWEKQTDLANAQEHWGKAEAFYASGSFDQAEQYAVKAQRDAFRVTEGGQTIPEPIFDPTLLFNVIALLIIALIAVYLLRNRTKIMGFVSPGQEEEVKLNEFED